MREYFEFWRRCFVFRGRSTRWQFWFSISIHIFLTGILEIVEMLIWSFTFDRVLSHPYVTAVFFWLSFIPMTAVTVRRLRDAGFSCRSYFWLLVPVIGFFAFIARLCEKSKKIQAVE